MTISIKKQKSGAAQAEPLASAVALQELFSLRFRDEFPKAIAPLVFTAMTVVVESRSLKGGELDHFFQSLDIPPGGKAEFLRKLVTFQTEVDVQGYIPGSLCDYCMGVIVEPLGRNRFKVEELTDLSKLISQIVERLT